MFPIGDDNSRRVRTPIVTYVLIALNVLVFLYQLSLGQGVQGFIERWAVVPANILQGEGLLTLLTSMFMHGGYAHIFGNMLFLWTFGDNVEDAMGHLVYLVFYLLTGLVASAAHIFLNMDSTIPSLGASGAISGVLGAYIVMFGTNAVRVLIGYFVTVVPAWIMIGLWAVQQFLATYATIADTAQTGGVAYAAHAGGFLAGLVGGVLARTMERPRVEQTVARRTALGPR
jgi:membrane associated rhomboid family serine protease